MNTLNCHTHTHTPSRSFVVSKHSYLHHTVLMCCYPLCYSPAQLAGIPRTSKEFTIFNKILSQFSGLSSTTV